MSERDNDYTDRATLPSRVERAAELAERFDFHNSCAIVYAPLLQTLVAQVRGGVIGEMGTGAGVGIAWMLEALDPSSRIVSIEQHVARAAAVAELYSDREDVMIVQGDALEIASHGPFDLMFCDAGPGKVDHQDVTISMMKPGGTILLDDLGPTRRDLDWWYESPDVVTSTVWITPELGAILAVKR